MTARPASCSVDHFRGPMPDPATNPEWHRACRRQYLLSRGGEWLRDAARRARAAGFSVRAGEYEQLAKEASR